MSNWPVAPPVSPKERAEWASNVAGAEVEVESAEASEVLGYRDPGARLTGWTCYTDGCATAVESPGQACSRCREERGDFDTSEDEAGEITDDEDLIPDRRWET